jgi:predicted Zn-dependent peptidase
LLEIPFERETLGNGLRVVLSTDRTVPVVAVNLWYGVGSRNERRGRTGFAHLFEHMMFQGSVNVAKSQHFELVERAGGSVNASTWFDRTNYYQTIPSHHLELALWLESDRMGWMLPAMTQEKLDNQRDVVKNERRWRYENRPYGDWDERLQALAFPPSHPYHHPVIGSMDDIDAATLEDVEDFFRTFYIPNNAVLTVCGDCDPDETLRMIERYFGRIPRGNAIPPLPGQPDLPSRIGGTVRRDLVASVPLPRVYMASRIPPFSDDLFTVAEVASAVLGIGRASRLYRSLVRERRLAKDVGAYVYPLLTGSGLFLSWATGYSNVETEELETALATETEGLAQAVAGEVDRALAMAETRVVKGLEGAGRRADLLSMYELYFGDPGRVNSEIERLRSATPDRVGDFARTHFHDENRAVVTYTPGGDS